MSQYEIPNNASTLKQALLARWSANSFIENFFYQNINLGKISPSSKKNIEQINTLGRSRNLCPTTLIIRVVG